MDLDLAQTHAQPKYEALGAAGEADELEMANMSSARMPIPGPVERSYEINYQDRGMPILNEFSSKNPLLDAQGVPPSRKFVLPAHHGFWSNRSVLTDWWFWELVNWIIGTLCMLSIAIILHTFDGQLLPKWRFGITINTLISTFASIARACLMVPIAQGLSQLKWTWVTRGSRSLVDFQDFDLASRGWYGSMNMLFTRRYWSLPALPIIGAIFMVFSLATEPITQQSVSYPNRLMADNSSRGLATSQRSTSFTAFDVNTAGGASGGPHDVDASTQAAIYSGVLYGNNSVQILSPTCSSGNCTWPVYTSLGVCASIADVTSNLTGSCIGTVGSTPACTYYLGGGLVNFNFEGASYYTFTTNNEVNGVLPPKYNGTDPNVRTVAFKDTAFPIVDFFVVFPQVNSETEAVTAAEIMLQFCVQTLDTTVTRGVASTNVTDWFTNFTLDGDPYVGGSGGNLTARPPGGEEFLVDGASFSVLATNLITLFSANFTLDPDGDNSGFPNPGIQGLYASLLDAPYNVQGLQVMAGNLATSLSNNIRGRNTTSPSTGTAFVEVTFVQVDWNWISLISILVIASITFMFLVIADNSRVDNLYWKSSSLATLKALDSSVAAVPSSVGLNTNWQMENIAKTTKVRLHKGDRGWMMYPQ